MRRFLSALLVFIILQGLVIAGIFAYYTHDHVQPDDYMGSARDKAALLASAPSPKVVFVGGSNVALGIDSEQAAHALPLQPVNLGLMSGVGYEMMAAQVEPHLREGDVVVLSLEYERWVHRLEEMTVWQTLHHHPGAWRDVPASYVPDLLDTSLAYLGGMARAARMRLAGRSSPGPPAPYLRSGFNEFGDLTLHRGIVHDRAEPLGRADIDALRQLSEAHVRETAEWLNGFHERARARGALVYHTNAAVTPEIYDEWSQELTWLSDLLDRELTIPLLDRPDELVYPREYFTDHIYHLNGQGIDRRMDLLLERLTAQLEAAGHPGVNP